MVLRLTSWRARSLARVLEEWSAVSRAFDRGAARPVLTELELSRTLDLAASVLGAPEPITPSERGDRVVPSRQRLDAVAVLAERESRLSALQRLALVDTAASWLSEPNGGDQLAYALLGAACTAEVTTEQVYLALITPPENPGDQSEGLPSTGGRWWSRLTRQRDPAGTRSGLDRCRSPVTRIGCGEGRPGRTPTTDQIAGLDCVRPDGLRAPVLGSPGLCRVREPAGRSPAAQRGPDRPGERARRPKAALEPRRESPHRQSTRQKTRQKNQAGMCGPG